MTTTSIEMYLDELKKSLEGSDKATLQDALSDAEEHLSSALENARLDTPEGSEAELLTVIIEAYGSPEEIASAYQGVESLIQPSLAPAAASKEYKNSFTKFFGIYSDPKAWGSVLYLLVSLLTGIAYFTWAVTGLSLSIGLAILIIGVPFAAFFLLSSRWIGLVEGRVVEALLGVRMPRRVIFFPKDLSLQEKLKFSFTNITTWKTILYMLLQLPLGIVYFTGVITLGALGFSLFAAPVIQVILGIPAVAYFNGEVVILSNQILPLLSILGLLLFTSTLHLAKIVGKMHGSYAKKMLVSE